VVAPLSSHKLEKKIKNRKEKMTTTEPAPPPPLAKDIIIVPGALRKHILEVMNRNLESMRIPRRARHLDTHCLTITSDDLHYSGPKPILSTRSQRAVTCPVCLVRIPFGEPRYNFQDSFAEQSTTPYQKCEKHSYHLECVVVLLDTTITGRFPCCYARWFVDRGSCNVVRSATLLAPSTPATTTTTTSTTKAKMKVEDESKRIRVDEMLDEMVTNCMTRLEDKEKALEEKLDNRMKAFEFFLKEFLDKSRADTLEAMKLILLECRNNA
jgi:hypothetical protein